MKKIFLISVLSLVIVSLLGFVFVLFKMMKFQEEGVVEERNVAQELLSEKLVSKLDQVISEMNGRDLKSLYLDLENSPDKANWELMAAVTSNNGEELDVEVLREKYNDNPSNIFWYIAGLAMLNDERRECFTIAKEIDETFDEEEYSSRMSSSDIKSNFQVNLNLSLALKKYEQCFLDKFDMIKKIGEPAITAYYERLALLLSSQFETDSTLLYEISENSDWCTWARFNEETQKHCLAINMDDTVLKLRKYYQITNAVEEKKKQGEEWFNKTSFTYVGDMYKEEKDTDEFARKKIKNIGFFIEAQRLSESGIDMEAALSSNVNNYNKDIRRELIKLRDDFDYTGILDDLDLKIVDNLQTKSLSEYINLKDFVQGDISKNDDVNNIGVHPVKGVRFSRFGKIDKENDKVFTKEEINQMLQEFDTKSFQWGIEESTGEVINMTGKEYFLKYITDETPIDFNSILDGTKIKVYSFFEEENILPIGFKETYPKGYSVLRKEPNGENLWFIYEGYENSWYLVAIVHG